MSTIAKSLVKVETIIVSDDESSDDEDEEQEEEIKIDIAANSDDIIDNEDDEVDMTEFNIQIDSEEEELEVFTTDGEAKVHNQPKFSKSIQTNLNHPMKDSTPNNAFSSDLHHSGEGNDIDQFSKLDKFENSLTSNHNMTMPQSAEDDNFNIIYKPYKKKHDTNIPTPAIDPLLLAIDNDNDEDLNIYKKLTQKKETIANNNNDDDDFDFSSDTVPPSSSSSTLVFTSIINDSSIPCTYNSSNNDDDEIYGTTNSNEYEYSNIDDDTNRNIQTVVNDNHNQDDNNNKNNNHNHNNGIDNNDNHSSNTDNRDKSTIGRPIISETLTETAAAALVPHRDIMNISETDEVVVTMKTINNHNSNADSSNNTSNNNNNNNISSNTNSGNNTSNNSNNNNNTSNNNNESTTTTTSSSNNNDNTKFNVWTAASASLNEIKSVYSDGLGDMEVRLLDDPSLLKPTKATTSNNSNNTNNYNKGKFKSMIPEVLTSSPSATVTGATSTTAKTSKSKSMTSTTKGGGSSSSRKASIQSATAADAIMEEDEDEYERQEMKETLLLEQAVLLHSQQEAIWDTITHESKSRNNNSRSGNSNSSISPVNAIPNASNNFSTSVNIDEDNNVKNNNSNNNNNNNMFVQSNMSKFILSDYSNTLRYLQTLDYSPYRHLIVTYDNDSSTSSSSGSNSSGISHWFNTKVSSFLKSSSSSSSSLFGYHSDDTNSNLNLDFENAQQCIEFPFLVAQLDYNSDDIHHVHILQYIYHMLTMSASHKFVATGADSATAPLPESVTVIPVPRTPVMPESVPVPDSVPLSPVMRVIPDSVPLSPVMRVIPVFGSHWDDIGFQGLDPRTDLNRSMKMLTLLLTLHMIDAESELTHRLFALSTYTPNNNNSINDNSINNNSINNNSINNNSINNNSINNRDNTNNTNVQTNNNNNNNNNNNKKSIDLTWPFMCVSVHFTKETLQTFRSGALNSACQKRQDVLSVMADFHHACFFDFGRRVVDNPNKHHAIHLAELRKSIESNPKEILKRYFDVFGDHSSGSTSNSSSDNNNNSSSGNNNTNSSTTTTTTNNSTTTITTSNINKKRHLDVGKLNELLTHRTSNSSSGSGSSGSGSSSGSISSSSGSSSSGSSSSNNNNNTNNGNDNLNTTTNMPTNASSSSSSSSSSEINTQREEDDDEKMIERFDDLAAIDDMSADNHNDDGDGNHKKSSFSSLSSTLFGVGDRASKFKV